MPALSQSTFSGASGAVNDLFAGLGAKAQGALKAAGLNIQAEGIRQTAEGTRIGAEGTRIGAEGVRIGAQGTRLTAESLRTKGYGDLAEASNYDLAAEFARQNEDYTAASTNIKASQLERSVTQTIGGQRAGTAGAGLAASGSALSLMADSASQGALARHVLISQGQITEAGYEEQAKSYDTMAATGRATAFSEFGIAGETDALADRTDQIASRTDLLADRSDKIALGQEDIANRTDALAQQTQAAADQAATGDFISGALKAVGAVAGVVLAPATAGASLALTAESLGTLASTSPGDI